MFQKGREAGKGDVESSLGGGELYLVHRVLADFPQAYEAVRAAFRAREAALRPVLLCSQCKCKLEMKDGEG